MDSSKSPLLEPRLESRPPAPRQAVPRLPLDARGKITDSNGANSSSNCSPAAPNKLNSPYSRLYNVGEDTDKTTPSLNSSANSDSELEKQADLAFKRNQPEKDATPLPVAKMVILSALQLTEAVVITQVLPYLPFMVQDLLDTDNLDPRIATYTGLLAGSFAFAQFFTSYPWGWISDRIGRRPVILIGLVGNIVTIPLFGFSSSLFMAFAFRMATGIINGNVGVLKSYLTEILDASNQAKGFSIVTLNFAIGLIIGPTVGGALYGIAEKGFLARYPWALPSFVSASMSVFALALAFFKLDETLPPEERAPWCLGRSAEDCSNRSGGSNKSDSLLHDSSSGRHSSPSSSSSMSSPQKSTPAHALSLQQGVAASSSQPFHSHGSSVPAAGPPPNANGPTEAITAARASHVAVPNSHAQSHDPRGSSSRETSSSESSAETVKRIDAGAAEHSIAVSVDSPSSARPSNTALLLRNRVFLLAISLYGITALIFIAFETTYPLWAKISREDGGWGLSPRLIGVSQSSGSVGNIIMQLFVFHRISRRFGLLRIYRFFWLLPMASLLCFPLLDRVTDRTSQMVLIVVVQLAFAATAGVVFTVSFMLISNSVNREVLGTANGLGQMMASFTRTIGPSLIGLLFGKTLEFELSGDTRPRWLAQVPFFNRDSGFYVCAVLTLVAIAISWFVPARYNQPRPPKFRPRESADSAAS